MLGIRDGARQMIVGVEASCEVWGAIMQQDDKIKDPNWSPYEWWLQNKADKTYDMGKCECCRLMQGLRKFCNNVYRVRFFMVPDANTLAPQLNLPTNDQLGALVTSWIAWIWLFTIDKEHVPGRLNGGPDGHSWRLSRDMVPDPEEEDYLEQIIKPSWGETRVKRGPEQTINGRAYPPTVRSSIVDKYNGKWNKIGKFLTNLMQPQAKTFKEMQQFRWEATKYPVSDGILYRRRKTNQLPA